MAKKEKAWLGEVTQTQYNTINNLLAKHKQLKADMDDIVNSLTVAYVMIDEQYGSDLVNGKTELHTDRTLRPVETDG